MFLLVSAIRHDGSVGHEVYATDHRWRGLRHGAGSQLGVRTVSTMLGLCLRCAVSAAHLRAVYSLEQLVRVVGGLRHRSALQAAGW